MKNNEGKKLLLSILLMPFAVVIHGYVLSILWNLFVVSTFNVSPITVIQAAGVMFVIDFILMKIDWTDEMLKVPMAEFVTKWASHALISPFVVLGMGYILALFL